MHACWVGLLPFFAYALHRCPAYRTTLLPAHLATALYLLHTAYAHTYTVPLHLYVAFCSGTLRCPFRFVCSVTTFLFCNRFARTYLLPGAGAARSHGPTTFHCTAHATFSLLFCCCCLLLLICTFYDVVVLMMLLLLLLFVTCVVVVLRCCCFIVVVVVVVVVGAYCYWILRCCLIPLVTLRSFYVCYAYCSWIAVPVLFCCFVVTVFVTTTLLLLLHFDCVDMLA